MEVSRDAAGRRFRYVRRADLSTGSQLVRDVEHAKAKSA